MERSEIIAVLQAALPNGFIPVFFNAVANVAKQKPKATGNSFMTDVGYRMVSGFHFAISATK
jgi:hypothetical protein